MGTIAFNTPILHRAPSEEKIVNVSGLNVCESDKLNTQSSLIGKINDIADDYFSFSSVRYVKTNFYSDNKRVITPVRVRRNIFSSFVKFLSYFTVVIPIYMLFHKIVYRATLSCTVRSNDDVLNMTDDMKVKKNTNGYVPTAPNKVKNHVFTYDKNRLSLKQSGLGKKPQVSTVNSGDIPNEVVIADLKVVAQSLEIGGQYLQNLEWLQNKLENEAGNNQALQQTSVYIRAIMNLFNKTQASAENTKEVLINIGRDCNAGTCNPGILTKVQKEYAHLVGAGEDDVEQIFLRELDDLKLERLNVMANDYTTACWHPHFISAAQVMMEEELGLNAQAGRMDRYYDNETRHFNTANKKLAFMRDFQVGYNPELVVPYVMGKINGCVDTYGITLHIGAFREFITKAFKEQYYPQPNSLDSLRNGPLKAYVQQAEEENMRPTEPSLEELYTDAIELYISEEFFHFDENLYCDKHLTESAIVFILKEIGVLN